jgi:hypothetical protein
VRRNQNMLFVALGSATVLAAGCVDAGESLVILQNQVAQDGCLISGDAGGVFRGEGFIDTDSQVGYFFTPVVQSRVEAGGDALRRLVSLEGAEISLGFQDNLFDAGELADLRALGLVNFTRRFSGSIRPGGTVGLGFDILDARLLPRLAQKVSGDSRELILARVVVFGKLSGSSIESDPFTYPITVCTGCLKQNLGDCTALPAGFEPARGSPCGDLQDSLVQCCTSDGVEICPAVVLGGS